MNKIKLLLSNYWLILLILLVMGIVFVFYFYLVEIFLFFFDKHSAGITAISAILAVIFVSSWLDTSKKKLKGKLNYDISRKYLKSVLELRDAIKIARNPFIPIGEMEVALKENGLSTGELNKKDIVNRSVYSLRWKNVQEAWTNFEEILTEAEVSWGNKAVETQEDLDELIRILRGAVWLFVNYPEDFHKKGQENRKLIYGTHDENDEFAKKINAEIEKIRSFLQGYL